MSEKAALGQVLRGFSTMLGEVLPGIDEVVTFHHLSTMVLEVEWVWPDVIQCCTTVGDRDFPDSIRADQPSDKEDCRLDRPGQWVVSNLSNWSVTDDVHNLCNVRDLSAPIPVKMRDGSLLWADQAGDITLQGWSEGNRAALTVPAGQGQVWQHSGCWSPHPDGGHMSLKLGGAHLKGKEGVGLAQA